MDALSTYLPLSAKILSKPLEEADADEGNLAAKYLECYEMICRCAKALTKRSGLEPIVELEEGATDAILGAGLWLSQVVVEGLKKVVEGGGGGGMEMKIVAGNLLLGVAYSEAIAPTILQVSEWLRSDPTCARTDFCLISPNQCEVRSYNVQYECALGTGFRTHLPSCKRKTATTPSPSKLSLCQPATKNTHTQTLLLFLNTHKKTTRQNHFVFCL